VGCTDVTPNKVPRGSTSQFRTVINGVFPSNCYICPISASGDCFIVDPGLDPAPIEAELGEQGWRPRAVLCTHGHFDHAGSAAHFQRAYGCDVYLHVADEKTLRSSNFLLMAFKIPTRITIPKITPLDSDRLELTIGDTFIRFHPSPGHTPGSCALEFNGSLFTGDTLFSRGVGLSQLPGEELQVLRRSIRWLLESFPSETLILPGHGNAAELGWIMANNTALFRFLQGDCGIMKKS
jgi:hydroxyacylglutathione hydrolase